MSILRLEKIDDDRLNTYARLTDVQLRSRLEPEKAILIAESAKVIERALDARLTPLSMLVCEGRLEPDGNLIERLTSTFPDTDVFVLPDEEIEKLTGFELTRGSLAAFRRPPQPGIDELLRDARRIAVLEGITNHTNVGAIFRSAAALGVDAVLVSPDCYDPFYRRAIRVSMGTVFQVPWTRTGRLSGPDGIAMLKRKGFLCAAMALRDDALALGDPLLSDAKRLAIVLGTEGDGLAQATIDACDITVRIPMHHGVDSLNVAAASAVAFWETRIK